LIVFSGASPVIDPTPTGNLIPQAIVLSSIFAFGSATQIAVRRVKMDSGFIEAIKSMENAYLFKLVMRWVCISPVI
jgi:hypothetical protein